MQEPSPRQELEQLVVEQICIFKGLGKMNDTDILKYHLRHYRIMALYRDMDRIRKTGRTSLWNALPGDLESWIKAIHNRCRSI